VKTEQISRLRRSLKTLSDRSTDVSAEFYRQLFAMDPSLRTMFPDDLLLQRRKFVDTLAALIAALDQPQKLDAMYAEMGRRHAGYGVDEAHYDIVGAALLAALRALHGDLWDDGLEEAWASFYGELAEAMIGSGAAAA